MMKRLPTDAETIFMLIVALLAIILSTTAAFLFAGAFGWFVLALWGVLIGAGICAGIKDEDNG